MTTARPAWLKSGAHAVDIAAGRECIVLAIGSPHGTGGGPPKTAFVVPRGGIGWEAEINDLKPAGETG